MKVLIASLVRGSGSPAGSGLPLFGVLYSAFFLVGFSGISRL